MLVVVENFDIFYHGLVLFVLNSTVSEVLPILMIFCVVIFRIGCFGEYLLRQLVNHLHSLNDVAECRVITVKIRCVSVADKELA